MGNEYSTKTTKTFRIDRIDGSSLVVSKEQAVRKPERDLLSKYSQRTFSMMADEKNERTVVLRCKNNLITIMVDRFGNAAYMHAGAMFSSGAFERLFDYFLSEDYTETAAINALPAPLGAPAYTPAENWGVKAENGRAVGMRLNGEALDLASWIQSIYVIEADTAGLSFSVPAGADLDLTMVVDSMGAYHPLSALLTGDGDFRLAMPLSLDADSAYEYAVLVTPENDEYGALIFHSEAEADLTV